MDYLNMRGRSNQTQGRLMSWMTDNQASGDGGATQFLKDHAVVWIEWVTPEAAEKIHASPKGFLARRTVDCSCRLSHRMD